jgi:hypothetical protein
MLSLETVEGINKRIRSTNPTWMIVGGPDLKHLSPYREKISLMVFTDIFYKQLNSDVNRTKKDIVQVAYEVAKLMKLNPTKELAEKLIDSLMWSEGKDFARFSFLAETFNEEVLDWEEQRYQYFTLDREYSDLENQVEVFQLTEEAQELVIKSQEIMTEFDLTLQTVISEILIKKGKFKAALNTLQNLDMKVRRLIMKEEEHKKQILKDPKGAIYLEYKKWGESLEEVKMQFQEELARYDEMERMLKVRYEREPENEDISKLFYRISVTRREHDKLSQLVIGNIQKEFKFRSDPSLFTLMWRPPESTFKTTVMEEKIIPKGIRNPDDIFRFINILFSPSKKFIYPMQWMIKEQGYRNKQAEFDRPDSFEDDDGVNLKLDIEWDEIVELWTPLIEEILEKGKISNTDLLTLPEHQLQRWIDCREAMDMWILFLMRDRTFKIPEKLTDKSNDQKINLLGKVIGNNHQLKELLGREFIVKPLNKRTITIDGVVKMVPINISLI